MNESAGTLFFWLTPIATGLFVFVIGLWYEKVWDRISAKYVNKQMPTIRRLNIDESRIPFYLRIWGGLVFVALLIFVFAPPLGIAAIFFAFIAPKIYLNFLISRRRVLLRDQLVTCTKALADTTRAGLSLVQGLETVQNDTPKPLSDEIGTIVNDFNYGLPLTQAIEKTKDRLQHESFTIMSSCLLTSLERGGNTSQALERISRSLQENQRLERKMESDTAGGRRVLMILAIFPALFLLLFLLVFPSGTMQLFTSLIGQIVLLVVIGLVYFSVSWGHKIMRLE